MNLLDLLVKIGVDDQASEKIAGVAAKAKGGFAAVGKAAGLVSAAVSAVAGSAVVAIGKQALDSYAQFEQLEGGIDKLYGTAGKSRKKWIEESDKTYEEANAEWMAREEAFTKVSKNAQQAFRTAGMSANEYMETATSFSASLINSLGGDTVKAAEYTDVAIRAMSDNVNTFGSNADDVKNAIMGISRENYTMVDNLKLGYAGTKEGFSQLIADANAYAESIGQVGDLQMGSFADAIRAIELIQQKQQIAGTTINEAGKTIEGSVNAAKAAWANLVTEFGKSEGDISGRVSDFITSIFGDGTDENLGVVGNIGPRIVTIVGNIVDAIPMIIEQVTPYLEQISVKLQEFVDEHQEEIDALAQMLWDGIVQALSLSIQMAFAALGTFLMTLITTFPQWAPMLLEAAVMLFVSILQGISETIPKVLEALTHLLGDLIRYVTGYKGSLLEAAQNLFHNIGDAVTNVREFIVSSVQDAIDSAISAVTGFFTDAYNVGSNIVQGIADGIAASPNAIIDALWGGVGGAIDTVKGWLGIASPSKLFAQFGRYTMEGFALGIDDKADAPEKAMMDAAQSIYGAASGKIDFGMQASPATGVPGMTGFGGVSIIINDPVITKEADVDAILEYAEAKIRRRVGQWNPSLSMA